MLRLRLLLATAILFSLFASSSASLGPLSAASSSPLAQAAVISDDFNDNAMNSGMWTAYVIGIGPTMAETNGQLEITIPATASDEPTRGAFSAGYSSICRLRGDFDIQVDYRLLTWPYGNGVRVGLTSDLGATERVSFGNSLSDFPGYPREVYLTDFTLAAGYNYVAVTPASFDQTSGKLRLARTGTTVTGYYSLPGGQWISIGSFNGAQVSSDVRFNLHAWSHNYAFADQNVKVAFDNFVANQGQLACPALFDDFSSYPTGQPPAGWDQVGTPLVTPVIEEVGGTGNAYKQLSFPSLGSGRTDKWLLYRDLTCADPSVTVKVNFRENADSAGILLAWVDQNNYIKVQPNVYWDYLGFDEWVNGVWRTRIGTPNGSLPVNTLTDYWLRVSVGVDQAGSKTATVYWSTDGANFRSLLTVPGLVNLAGKVGLVTSGFNVPHTHFDDFTVTGNCQAGADLSISKSASPNPVMVGSTLTYSLVVTNNGPSPATAVTLTDTLPSGVNFVSKVSSQGSCNGTSTITCTLGNLSAGASATVTIVARPTAPQTITNTATVSATEPDPNKGNNTAVISTTITPPGLVCDPASGGPELASAFRFPLDAGFTRYFTFKEPYPSDFRVVAWRGTYHPGVDSHLSLNAKAYSVANGVVFRKKADGTGYGNYVVIEHVLTRQWGGGRVYSVYAHLRDYEPAPAVGCPVQAGQLIGYEGASGEGAGGVVHLHFELRKPSGVDPWNTYPYPVGGTDPAHNIDNFLDPDIFIPTHAQ